MPEALPLLLSDFPRGDPDRKPEDFSPPAAAFAKPSLVKASPLLAWQQGKPGKLFLGILDGELKEDDNGSPFVMGGHPVGISDNRHICTFAGSRAGKGRSAIVPNMLHYPGSILATDPKGELATITARQRVALGQDVHVLDPFGEAVGYPHKASLLKGFNPIQAMRPGRLIEDASLISDALVVSSEKADPHWNESARAFIEGVVLHVRTWPDYEGRRSLLTVREVVGQGAKDDDKAKAPSGFSMQALAADMRHNKEASGVIQTAAADFFDRPPNEQGSVLSSARRHLKFIDLFRETKIGRLTLERHDFELDALKTKPTTIYLCLPARHIGTCSRWLRLFVNLTLQSMERTRVTRLPANVPVLCVLDEFASLGHLKQVEDAAGQIAGFGVQLWPILQDMGQLKALYAERWETFLGNAGVLQFFGNNDLTTLDWISKRCGRASIVATRQSDTTVHQGMGGATGESWQTEVHDLLTPDEAARFFGRDDPKLRQLIIWAGRKNPLLVLQRAYYDKHALFRDAAGQPLFDNVLP
jgi:type IV secretion system protein VirD4